MSKKFEDKIVVVTGGGRGIGRAICLAFAKEGARVAACARSVNEINRVAEEIRAAGGEAIAVAMDVTDERSVNKGMNAIRDRFGRIDILVNNAGAAIFKPLSETTLDDWNKMVAVNMTGVFLCCKAVLSEMMERKSGRIINIASSAGLKGYPNQSAYCASKHGVVGFSKVLALELQPYNIRVNVVCPGGVDTRLVREGRDDVDVTKYMRPEEIADVVIFLASQNAIATIDEVFVRRTEARPWG